MADIVIIAIIVLIVCAACAYIIREKKKGTRCIGCPSSGGCAHCKSTSEDSCGCSSR